MAIPHGRPPDLPRTGTMPSTETLQHAIRAISTTINNSSTQMLKQSKKNNNLLKNCEAQLNTVEAQLQICDAQLKTCNAQLDIVLVRLVQLKTSAPTPVRLPASQPTINHYQPYSASPPSMDRQLSHFGFSGAENRFPRLSLVISRPEAIPPSPSASKDTRTLLTPHRQLNIHYQISAVPQQITGAGKQNDGKIQEQPPSRAGCGMKFDCRALTLVLHGLMQSGGSKTVPPPTPNQQFFRNTISTEYSTNPKNLLLLNTITKNSTTFPSPTMFDLAPFLSPQLLYPPNVARRPRNFQIKPITKLSKFSDRLSPQYLFPPNETRLSQMHRTTEHSQQQTTTQQYVHHPINCSLSPQYLYPPNPARTCCA
mmetsp:Transcript_36450/g.71729  ORF Transcript_36450/g.71729 Transcript_36450/m.71729 type:complete len:368 (-) Transcript_36450:132-1235(-)